MLPYQLDGDFILTLAVNYSFILGLYATLDIIFKTFGVTSFFGMALASSMAISILWLKEQVSFVIWGSKIAKCKREYSMSSSDWWYVIQTQAVFVFIGVLTFRKGLYYWAPLEFSLRYYVQTVGNFYILQFLKDMVLLVLHKMMHENPKLYSYHKEHHTVNKNAQNLMALHIDVIDLFLENLCAPVLMLLVLYISGRPVTMHFGSMILSTIMDIEIHAINPHTPCLFNPIMDYFFRCNLAHQIHHSRQTENYMFIPYHHINSKLVKEEMRGYDEIMKTSFFSRDLAGCKRKQG